MNLQQLKKVQQAIESFFYKIRFNIGLYNLLHNRNFYNFQNKINDALKKQILYFAKVEKINDIIGFEKAVKELTEKDLLTKIKKLWIPLTAFIGIPILNSYLRRAAEKGGQIGLDKLKIDKKFKLVNKKILELVEKRTKESIELIDRTTQDWIARTIEQGLRDNLSHIEIAKLLRNNAIQSAKERSTLIAEQEAALMIGELETEVYKKNGIESYKWITSRDELVCIDCMANEEAGEVKVGEIFPGGVLTTPQHQRCRCMIMPILSKTMEITWTGQ